MFDGAARTCPQQQLYHPHPVRPTYTSAFSAPPFFSSSSSSSSSGSPPSTGSVSATSSPSPPATHAPLPPTVLPAKSQKRPKMAKKLSSNTAKVKNVQVSLEVKVERSRGFHAFFVPLARGMPPAPPSSPVFGHSAPPAITHEAWAVAPKTCERWVEDVDVERMDLD